MDRPVTHFVKIRPDNNIRPAMFVPDPFIPGAYKANPVTIRALRKDLNFADVELLDTQKLYTCISCNTKIDLQYWIFCPHCEKSLPKDLPYNLK